MSFLSSPYWLFQLQEPRPNLLDTSALSSLCIHSKAVFTETSQTSAQLSLTSVREEFFSSLCVGLLGVLSCSAVEVSLITTSSHTGWDVTTAAIWNAVPQSSQEIKAQIQKYLLQPGKIIHVLSYAKLADFTPLTDSSFPPLAVFLFLLS